MAPGTANTFPAPARPEGSGCWVFIAPDASVVGPRTFSVSVDVGGCKCPSRLRVAATQGYKQIGTRVRRGCRFPELKFNERQIFGGSAALSAVALSGARAVTVFEGGDFPSTGPSDSLATAQDLGFAAARLP
jgi:hypothetical protein